MIKKKKEVSEWNDGAECMRLICENLLMVKIIEIILDHDNRYLKDPKGIYKKEYSYIDIAMAKRDLCQELLDLINDKKVDENFDPDKRLGN